MTPIQDMKKVLLGKFILLGKFTTEKFNKSGPVKLNINLVKIININLVKIKPFFISWPRITV